MPLLTAQPTTNQPTTYQRLHQPGGWFDAAEGSDPALSLRLKEDYDGAEPAPASIATANLVRLAALMPGGSSAAAGGSGGGGSKEEEWMARGDGALAAAAGRLSGRATVVMPQMCCSAWLRSSAPLRQVGGWVGGDDDDGAERVSLVSWLAGWLGSWKGGLLLHHRQPEAHSLQRPPPPFTPLTPTPQIIIAGAPSHPSTTALLSAAHASWPPDRSILVIHPADDASTAFWGAHNPRALAMVRAHYAKRQQGGEEAVPTAFVCQDYTCKAPTTDPEALWRLLREGGGAAGGSSGAGGGGGLSAFSWPTPQLPPAAHA